MLIKIIYLIVNVLLSTNHNAHLKLISDYTYAEDIVQVFEVNTDMVA